MEIAFAVKMQMNWQHIKWLGWVNAWEVLTGAHGEVPLRLIDDAGIIS
jgi:hypothetical protein